MQQLSSTFNGSVAETSAPQALSTRPPQRLRRALLLVRQLHCGTELWPLANALHAGGIVCTAVLGREARDFYAESQDIIRRYTTVGLSVIDYAGRPLSAEAPQSAAPPARVFWLRALLRRIKRHQGFTFGMRLILEFSSSVRLNLSNRLAARRLLTRLEPDVIVLQEYGHVCMEAIIVKTARALGIPALLVPGSDNGQIPEASLQAFVCSRRAALLDTRRLANRVVAWLFPHWVRTYRGIRMLRYPAAESLAAWCTGLMAGDPWLPNRWVQHRAVLCERARQDIIERQGFSSAQLMVTGQAVLDHAYRVWKSPEVRRREIFSALGLDGHRRRFILFSVPQLVPHHILTESKQMAFTESILRACAELPDAQVFMSLYTGGLAEVYAGLARAYGAVIVSGIDVRELIAFSDLVISVRSSIIWTAIACQKPVLALDFWDIGHVSFYECPGVTLIQREVDLAPVLRSLLTDPAVYARTVAALREAAPVWASGFDGRATERIVGLIERVAGLRRESGAEVPFSCPADLAEDGTPLRPMGHAGRSRRPASPQRADVRLPDDAGTIGFSEIQYRS